MVLGWVGGLLVALVISRLILSNPGERGLCVLQAWNKIILCFLSCDCPGS